MRNPAEGGPRVFGAKPRTGAPASTPHPSQSHPRQSHPARGEPAHGPSAVVAQGQRAAQALTQAQRIAQTAVAGAKGGGVSETPYARTRPPLVAPPRGPAAASKAASQPATPRREPQPPQMTRGPATAPRQAQAAAPRPAMPPRQPAQAAPAPQPQMTRAAPVAPPPQGKKPLWSRGRSSAAQGQPSSETEFEGPAPYQALPGELGTAAALNLRNAMLPRQAAPARHANPAHQHWDDAADDDAAGHGNADYAAAHREYAGQGYAADPAHDHGHDDYHGEDDYAQDGHAAGAFQPQDQWDEPGPAEPPLMRRRAVRAPAATRALPAAAAAPAERSRLTEAWPAETEDEPDWPEGGWDQDAEPVHDGAYRTGVHVADGERSPMARAFRISIGVVSLVFVTGLGVWGYGQVKRDVSGVPVVRALQGPIRVAPEVPGGQVADNTGLGVNVVQAEGIAARPATSVSLAPEAPQLAEEDLPLSELAAISPQYMQTPEETAAAALASGAVDAETGDDPIGRALALAESMTQGQQPLSAIEPTSSEIDPEDEGTTSGLEDPLEDAVAEAVAEAAAETTATPAVTTGGGAAVIRSLRPAPRPAGLRAAAVVPANGARTVADAASTAQDVSAPAAAGTLAADNVPEVEDVPPGTRLVQLGAFDTPDDARRAWAQVDGKVDGLMDDKTRLIQKAEAGGRTFWRLRVHGFDDLSGARRFCAAVSATKTDCIPVVAR